MSFGYNSNYTRQPKLTDNQDWVGNYYGTMQPYVEDFKAQWFDVKVVNAWTQKNSFKNKKTGILIEHEDLYLVCQIMQGDQPTSYYIEANIFGDKRAQNNEGEWGEWSSNDAIQDTAYLIMNQKPNVDTTQEFIVTNDWFEKHLRPNMAGVRLKLLAVTTDKRVSAKGKEYTINEFAFFNHDGRSALEVINNVNPQNKVEIKEKLKEYKSKYAEYCAKFGIAQTQQPMQQQAVQQVAKQEPQVYNDLHSAYASVQTQSVQAQEDNVDDILPF